MAKHFFSSYWWEINHRGTYQGITAFCSLRRNEIKGYGALKSELAEATKSRYIDRGLSL